MSLPIPDSLAQRHARLTQDDLSEMPLPGGMTPVHAKIGASHEA